MLSQDEPGGGTRKNNVLRKPGVNIPIILSAFWGDGKISNYGNL
jgi:hypothetical protein